jgi:hypothetical protein
LTDAGMLGGAGGALWFDYDGDFIGMNAPACIAIEGSTACASAYDEVIQCAHSAGCQDCATQASFDTCWNEVAGTNGACASYEASYPSACANDTALGNGPCTTSVGALSILCGNGSGDGG